MRKHDYGGLLRFVHLQSGYLRIATPILEGQTKVHIRMPSFRLQLGEETFPRCRFRLLKASFFLELIWLLVIVAV